MGRYEYSELTGNNIRLVRLLPGETHQDIKIRIDTVELVANCPSPSTFPQLMTADKLRPTLPPDWWVYDTVEDEVYFYYETGNGETWKASWIHPDSSINTSLYRKELGSHIPKIGGQGYEALSYTWRSNDPDEDAIVQDGSEESSSTSLQLGGNLACALRHLRQRDTVRTLWIDAICINQSNLEERGKQVARMASIYKSARRVVVWLGTGSEDSDLAMQSLDYLGKQVILTKDNWLFAPPDAEEPYWVEGTCSVPYSEEVWAAINRLLGRPWFMRVWIIQEIQLARHGAVIQCGREQIQWSCFRGAISCLWVSDPGDISTWSANYTTYNCTVC